MNDLKRVLNKSLGAFLALSLAAAPMRQVQAGPKAEQASERFERGVELYRAGDVRAANIEFKRAYAIDSNYRLLFNIAQASAELKDYVTAHRYFEQYLQEGQDEISQDRKSLVKSEIARMNSYLGQVELLIDAADATVFVDGVKRLPQEMKEGKLLVGAGRRTIAVTAPGYQRFERVLDIAGEDEIELEVDLQKLNAAPAPSTVVKVVPKKQSSRRSKQGMGSLFWAGVGTTTAFGAITLVLGFVTKRAERRNKLMIEQVPTTQIEIDQTARNLRGIAAITDISLGLTATAAVVTLAAGIARARRRKKNKEPKLRAGVHARGLTLHGRF